MAQEVLIKTVFQVKRGLASAWTRVNPILRAGEPGFELDTGLLKVGNGTNDWKTLPYIGGSNSGMNFRGTVATFEDLPSEGQQAGDIWQVTKDNSMYIWNPSTEIWEPFRVIDLSGYVSKKELEDGSYQLHVDRIVCGSSDNL